MNKNCFILSALAVLLFSHPTLWAQSPTIDPKADSVLQKMGKTLADAKAFSFTSYTTVDMFLSDGQKVQTARTQKVIVRRPDGVAAHVVGDNLNMHFVYDGKQILLHNTDKPSYAIVDAPPTINAAFDMLANDYGMVIPLADVLFADPYHTLIEHVKSGKDLGLGYVNETKCEHLAFRQDSVDWEVWVEQGDSSLLRKLVITYNDRPGAPEFTAVFTDWNLAATPTAEAFRIAPPAGVPKNDLIKLPPATQPSKE